MKRARDLWIGWLGLFALLALHMDFWRPQRPVIHFGWLPEELLYRLAWMGLAFVYLLFVTARLWPEDRP